jgi:hypothetical protein
MCSTSNPRTVNCDACVELTLKIRSNVLHLILGNFAEELVDAGDPGGLILEEPAVAVQHSSLQPYKEYQLATTAIGVYQLVHNCTGTRAGHIHTGRIASQYHTGTISWLKL